MRSKITAVFLALATLACAETLVPASNVVLSFDTTTPRYIWIVWSYSGPNDITGFRIERSDNGSDYSVIGTVPVEKPKTFLDRSTISGRHYWYRVVTLKQSFSKVSDPSAPAEADAK